MIRTAVVLTLFSIGIPVVAHAAPPDEVVQAREHYRKGTKAYDLGRYLEAAKEYEAAYEIKDDPALLYNIAQAYRLGGNVNEALRSYRSFLRRLPDAPNRAEVEAKILELQKLSSAQAKATSAPPTTTAPALGGGGDGSDARSLALVSTERTPPPKKKPLYKQWWPWTIAGAVVVVGVGVGVGVGLSRSSSSERVLPAVNGN